MEYAALVIIAVLITVLFLIASMEGGLWDGIKSIYNIFKENIPLSVLFIGLLFALLVLIGAAVVLTEPLSVKTFLVFK